MKSSNLIFFGKLSILIILVSYSFTIKVENLPETNSLNNLPGRVESKTQEKTKLEQSNVASKNSTKNHNHKNTNTKTNTNTNLVTLVDLNAHKNSIPKKNTHKITKVEVNQTNTTNVTEQTTQNNTQNNTQNTTENTPIPVENKEVYYYPNIGGIKINNPLKENVFNCAKCKNGNQKTQNTQEQVTFPNVPGVQFEKVNYTKELSAGGKAAIELEEINDPEYKRIVNNGYETPTFSTNVIQSTSTPVAKPTNVNYHWKPTDGGDAKLWQDVEYNRYHNNLLDTTRFNTQAYFTSSEGTNIVHAPSNSGLQVISPAKTTISSVSSQFLDMKAEDFLVSDDVDNDFTNDNFEVEKFLGIN